MKSLGQIAYEAYCTNTGWKSLATGADLPKWDYLKVDIRDAWEAAAGEVAKSIMPAPRKMTDKELSQLNDSRANPIRPGTLIIAGRLPGMPGGNASNP